MYSGFNGRRGPNVSQYLNNLNALPSTQDVQQPADLSLDDNSLDFLTNAQFVDFDADFDHSNGFGEPAPQDLALSRGNEAAPNFDFPDFTAYPASGHVASPSDMTTQPSALLTRFPADSQFAGSPTSSDKRTASGTLDLEDSSRMAAEEDKRRRNTAASARFRVKKKQREQALEKQAKEMTEKVQMLEGKVQALERENKWLKELITEKNDVKPVSEASLLERRKAAAADAVERSLESRTDGVGTAATSKPEIVSAES